MVRARESGTLHSVLATHLSRVQEMLFAVLISCRLLPYLIITIVNIFVHCICVL